ncbi:recombinase family protein [Mesorhizobium calcicola]|uniref:Recombinase family protein n=1 Tax=Mesorhizobium calcicola TaxID=1300310 RepID=A0ABW4WDB5_9HYPH
MNVRTSDWLGYSAVDKKLVVDEAGATTVRAIFQRYLELKSVLALAEELNQNRTMDGPNSLRPPISRGRLYHLLSNPVYIGQARHKNTCYDGVHQPIVDAELFASVQALLKEQGPRRRSQSNVADLHLLTGLVFDETGDRLSPAYASNHGKRYRYYISNRLKVARRTDDSGWRVPADELELIVDEQLIALLKGKSRLASSTYWLGRTPCWRHLQMARLEVSLSFRKPPEFTERTLARLCRWPSYLRRLWTTS